MIPERIVAEVSKNWPPTSALGLQPIATLFENAIKVNRDRGFDLESWRFSQIKHHDDSMTETIIAVFVRPSAPEASAPIGDEPC